MENIKFDAFQEIGDQSEDTYFIFDLINQKIKYINAAFNSIWRVSSKEVSKDYSKLTNQLHPEDKEFVLENFSRFLESKKKTTLNFRILGPNNDDSWLRLKAYPIFSGKEMTHVAGIIEDESPRLKIIFNMQKINARKNSALEILSHDLRGPIGIIGNLATLIERKLPNKENEDIHELTDMIKKICNRNVDMIQDLISQEATESTEIAVSKERLDVVWEIREVIENYQKSQENLSREFKLSHSDDQIYMEADSLKFMQIMNNLISNAIKFTHDNGIIQVDIKKKKHTILIIVKDNGIGIPKELQPMLFDKFSRASRVGINGEESVGLGMSIVKEMVELHDGKIWFKSKENIGSTFYIEIPNGYD
jgi:two-component system sensor histidine kinase VicK